jgi:hypothetical protein
VSSVEESMQGHVGVNGVYEKLGKGNTKGSMVGPRGIWRKRACFSLPGAFKTYANLWEGRNLWFSSINQWVKRGLGGSQARWGWSWVTAWLSFSEPWTFPNFSVPHAC